MLVESLPKGALVGQQLRDAELQGNCPKCNEKLVADKARVNTGLTLDGHKIEALVKVDTKLYHESCSVGVKPAHKETSLEVVHPTVLKILNEEAAVVAEPNTTEATKASSLVEPKPPVSNSKGESEPKNNSEVKAESSLSTKSAVVVKTEAKKAELNLQVYALIAVAMVVISVVVKTLI